MATVPTHNSKGNFDIEGLTAIEALLSEGNIEGAKNELDDYIQSHGSNEETNIVNISLLFESKTLYEVLLLEAEHSAPISFTDNYHRDRILRRASEIFACADAISEKKRNTLYQAIGTYIEEAVLMQEDISQKDALAFLHTFLPAFPKFTFSLFAQGQYTSVSEKIFLPKDKRYAEVERAILKRLSVVNRPLHGKEAQKLGELYLAMGDEKSAKTHLELALVILPEEEKHKALFRLLCIELHVRGEEDFVKAKGFTTDHPTYKKLMNSVRAQSELAQKYRGLAKAYEKAHEKKKKAPKPPKPAKAPKPKKEKKVFDFEKIRRRMKISLLYVALPCCAIGLLAWLVYVIFAGRFVYHLNDSGTGYIVSYSGILTTSELTIPEEYEGLPVTEIAEKGFKRKKNLEKIVIPDSVQAIGSSAFLACKNLKSVTIPEGVTTIGEKTFKKCKELTTINFPSSVTSINITAFEKCFSLTNITVDENNKDYKSIDGILYTKSGSTLIKYGAGRSQTSFTIPESVSTIEDAAFHSCNNLVTVGIPYGVSHIGMDAFRSCKSLEKTNIPSSVTYIEKYAFVGCKKLIDVEVSSYSNWHNVPMVDGGFISDILTYIPSSMFSDNKQAAYTLRGLTYGSADLRHY